MFRTEKKNFRSVFDGANPVAIDLLEKMLEIDTDKRCCLGELAADTEFFCAGSQQSRRWPTPTSPSTPTRQTNLTPRLTTRHSRTTTSA